GRSLSRYRSERQEVGDGSDDEDPDHADAEANHADLEVRAGLLLVRHDPQVTGTFIRLSAANIMPTPVSREFRSGRRVAPPAQADRMSSFHVRWIGSPRRSPSIPAADPPLVAIS